MQKIFTFIVHAAINSGILVFLFLAVKILPDSPFESFITASSIGHIWNYMKYVEYFVPVAQIIAILQAWVVCIVEWYLWRFIYDISKNLSSGGTDLMTLN